jgi:hypothetical protein
MKSRSITAPLMLTIALRAASVAHADVVTDWNSAALDAIRANRTPPPRASRALAILHASIYDAIDGITRPHRIESTERAPRHRVALGVFERTGILASWSAPSMGSSLGRRLQARR